MSDQNCCRISGSLCGSGDIGARNLEYYCDISESVAGLRAVPSMRPLPFVASACGSKATLEGHPDMSGVNIELFACRTISHLFILQRSNLRHAEVLDSRAGRRAI